MMERDCFQVVNRTSVSACSNVLGGRLVISIKTIGTKEEMMKTRYVVKGHIGKEKETLIHNSLILRHRSVRLVF